MSERLKNILIGLFVSAAIVIGISMILFLEPEVGDGKKTLLVRFANIAGINVGTRVTFAGKPVGEVISILEIPNARELSKGPNGQVYFYELKLKVDSSVDVYSTDDIAMRTTGLMGEKSIAILPKPPLSKATPTLITHQVIYANSTDPLENTFNQVTRVASDLQETLHHFDDWFEKNAEQLASAIQSFDGAMTKAHTVLGTIDEEALVPSLKSSIDLFSDNLRLVRTSLQEDELLHKTANLVENLNESSMVFNKEGAQTLKNLEAVSRDIAMGTGTLGRLLNSDDFYLHLTSVMSKAETLMNDINHYGLLFQYDKGWQRSRTKRANLLQSLDSPQEFKAYFETEMDTIQTSLGRLTELLDKAGGDAEREKVLQSEAFRKDFLLFLNQAEGLSQSIKLYSQKLRD